MPLYQDAVAAECVFPINNAEVRFALVEDQEQVDKMLESLPLVPTLKHIYYDDPRGLRNYTSVTGFDQLLEIGLGGVEQIEQGIGVETSHARAKLNRPRRFHCTLAYRAQSIAQITGEFEMATSATPLSL